MAGAWYNKGNTFNLFKNTPMSLTNKQKKWLQWIGGAFALILVSLAGYNGALFLRSDLFGLDMQANAQSKVFERLYSYNATTGSYPKDQGWIRSRVSGSTGSNNETVDGGYKISTSGDSGLVNTINWGAQGGDKLEITTKVQVKAAQCETYTSSYMLFSNGVQTGYLVFCENKILVSSPLQQWQRPAGWSPATKNLIENINLKDAPKTIKVVVEGTTIRVFEVTDKDVLLGSFADSFYTGIVSYSGLASANLMSPSSIQFGSLSQTVNGVDFGSTTTWHKVSAKVIPKNQSATTPVAFEHSYDAASNTDPKTAGWISTAPSLANIPSSGALTTNGTYTLALNAGQYDQIEVTTEIKTGELHIASSEAKADIMLNSTTYGLQYTDTSATQNLGNDTTIQPNTWQKLKIVTKGKALTITDLTTNKVIDIPYGMLRSPRDTGYISFSGTIKSIAVKASAYTENTTQTDANRIFSEVSTLKTDNDPDRQGWTEILSGTKAAQTTTSYNNENVIGLSSNTTSALQYAYNWNLTKEEDVTISLRMRVKQSPCSFSESTYLGFSNGEKMGYITFCMNEIRVGGEGLPLTRATKYNQLLPLVAQEKQQIFGYSGNMPTSLENFEITLKDGKDIIIKLPDGQVKTISNGLFFDAQNTTVSPHKNALFFGTGSNEISSTPVTSSEWATLNYKKASRVQDKTQGTYTFDATKLSTPSAQGWQKSDTATESAVSSAGIFPISTTTTYTKNWSSTSKDTIVLRTSMLSTGSCYGLSASNGYIQFSNGVYQGSVGICRDGIYISDPANSNNYTFFRTYKGEPLSPATINNTSLKNFVIIAKYQDITVLDLSTGKEVGTVWGAMTTKVPAGETPYIRFGGRNSSWKTMSATLEQDLSKEALGGVELKTRIDKVTWKGNNQDNTVTGTISTIDTIPSGVKVSICFQETGSTTTFCSIGKRTGEKTFTVTPKASELPLNNNLTINAAAATKNYTWALHLNDSNYGVEGPLTVSYNPEIQKASATSLNNQIKVLFDTITDKSATLQVGVAPSQSNLSLEKVCIKKVGTTSEICKTNTGSPRTMSNAPSITDGGYNWSMYYASFSASEGLSSGSTYDVIAYTKYYTSSTTSSSAGSFTTPKAAASTLTGKSVIGYPTHKVILPANAPAYAVVWSNKNGKAHVRFELQTATTQPVALCSSVTGGTSTCTTIPSTAGSTTYESDIEHITMNPTNTTIYNWNITIGGNDTGVKGSLTTSPSTTIPAQTQVEGTADPEFITTAISPLGDTLAHLYITSKGSTPLTDICIQDDRGSDMLCSSLEVLSESTSGNENIYTYETEFTDLIPGTGYTLSYTIGTVSYEGRTFRTSNTISADIGDTTTTVPAGNPIDNLTWITNENGQTMLKVQFSVYPTPSSTVNFCYKETSAATPTCVPASSQGNNLYTATTDIPLTSTKTYSWSITVGGAATGTTGTNLQMTQIPAVTSSIGSSEGTALKNAGITLDVTNVTNTGATLSSTVDLSAFAIKSLCVRESTSTIPLCKTQADAGTTSGNKTYTAAFDTLKEGVSYTTSASYTTAATGSTIITKDGQLFTTSRAQRTTVSTTMQQVSPNDTSAPTIIITKPSAESVIEDSALIKIEGTAQDAGVPAAGIDKLYYTLSRTNGTQTTYLSNTGNTYAWVNEQNTTTVLQPTGIETWSIPVGNIIWEKNFIYTLSIYGIDKGGNSGVSAPVTSTFSYKNLDHTAPSVTITAPTATSTTLAGSAQDTAIDATVSGVKSVAISIQDTTANTWWNGTAFTATEETYTMAQISVNGASATWSYPSSGALPFTNAHIYNIRACAVDNAGNSGSTAPSATTFTYTTATTTTATPTVSITTPAHTDLFFSGNATAQSTNSTISKVKIALRDTTQTTGGYWNGTDFSGTTETYYETTLSGQNVTSTWRYPSGTSVLPLIHAHTYAAKVYAEDSLGNSSQSQVQSATFTYTNASDTTPPVTTISIPTAGSTSLSGTAQDNGTITSSIKEVRVSIKNNATGTWWNGTTFTSAEEIYILAGLGSTGTNGTAWNTTVAFTPNTTYLVKAFSTDTSNNGTVAQATQISFTYQAAAVSPDTTAPAATINSIIPANPKIEGSAQDSGNVTSGIAKVYVSMQDTNTGLWWNGTSFALSSESYKEASLTLTGSTSATWSYIPNSNIFTLNHGYIVKAYAVDTSGNSGLTNLSSASFTYTEATGDRIAPSVLIAAPATGSQSISGIVTDSGNPAKGVAQVLLSIKRTNSDTWWNGSLFSAEQETYVPVQLSTTGAVQTTWSYPVTFENNTSYIIKAYAIDLDTNSSITAPTSLSFTFTALAQNTLPPVVSILATNSGSTLLQGTAKDVGTNTTLGISSVFVGLRDTTMTTGGYWNGTDFSGTGSTFKAAHLVSSGAQSTWFFPSSTGSLPLTDGHTYSILAYGVDVRGNTSIATPVSTTYTYQAPSALHSSSIMNGVSSTATGSTLSSIPAWSVDTSNKAQALLELSQENIWNAPVKICIANGTSSSCVPTLKTATGSYLASIGNDILPLNKSGTYLWKVQLGEYTLNSTGAVQVDPTLTPPLYNVGSSFTFASSTPSIVPTSALHGASTGTGSTLSNTSAYSNLTQSGSKNSTLYCPPYCPEGTFMPFDVSRQHFAFEAIETLAVRSIMKGYRDGTFRPNQSINRAEFSSIVKNAFMFSSSNAHTAAPLFKDVSLIDWFYESVLAIYNVGLVQGYPSGDFLPARSIQRDEAAKILAIAHAQASAAKLYREKTGKDATAEQVAYLAEQIIDSLWKQWQEANPSYTYVVYPDISVEAWSARYILYGYNAKLIKGRTASDTTIYAPADKITRAESAVLIERIINSLSIAYPVEKNSDGAYEIRLPK